MSENKSPRPVSEIQQEYQMLCTKAGHVQYQIFTLQKDLDVLNSTLRDLNLEASESKTAEDAKAAEEAKVKASEPLAEEKGVEAHA